MVVHKDKFVGSENYLHQSNEAGDNARCRLSGGSFKLWDYLARHSDGYPLWMSKAEAKEHGISERQYKSGCDELKEKGFIVWTGPKRTDYAFYEYPESHKKDKTFFLKRTERPLQNGQNEPFKKDETSRVSNISNIDKHINEPIVINISRSSCSKAVQQDTTTTTTFHYLSKFKDEVIEEAYPTLVEEFGDDIVKKALIQAWEGGPQKRNLRYIRATCAGMARDKNDGDISDEYYRDETIEDWD